MGKGSKPAQQQVPEAPKPIPVPTVDEAANKAESGDKMRRRRGAASTILSQQTGGDLAAAPNVSSGAKLLGQ